MTTNFTVTYVFRHRRATGVAGWATTTPEKMPWPLTGLEKTKNELGKHR